MPDETDHGDILAAILGDGGAHNYNQLVTLESHARGNVITISKRDVDDSVLGAVIGGAKALVEGSIFLLPEGFMPTYDSRSALQQ